MANHRSRFVFVAAASDASGRGALDRGDAADSHEHHGRLPWKREVTSVQLTGNSSLEKAPQIARPDPQRRGPVLRFNGGPIKI